MPHDHIGCRVVCLLLILLSSYFVLTIQLISMLPDDPFDLPDETDTADEQPEFISKSELKRQAQAATDLGKRLVALDKSTLNKLDLPEVVRDNVFITQGIKSNVAHKRQLQFLGKLIRNSDIEHIQQQLYALNQQHRQQNARFHTIENWRDRLITEGDSAITALLNDHPQADRQHLRQLVRRAQQEAEKNAPPAAARKLFQYLKELMPV